MKKIIFFSKNLEIGGMEKALVSLLNSLVSDYEITLVLEEKKGVLLSELDERIDVSEYAVSNSKNVILRKIINFSNRFIWCYKNKNKYDFSCSYATYSVIGSRLALEASSNNSLYVHSNYYDVYDGNNTKITDFFNMLKINDFRNVIFVSNESRKKMERIYPNMKNKFKTINNLIDYENIEKLGRKRIDYDFSEKTNFLFVGRLEEESKQLSLLIDSFSDAIKKNKDLRLIIIGDGKDKKLCENKIERLRIEKYVDMLGTLSNPYPYMKKADYLILTSKYEGYPVIYNEALVLNKMVLTTIPVSDSEISIKDYFEIMDHNRISISNHILKHAERKKKIKYNLDFKEINQKRVDRLKKIINN